MNAANLDWRADAACKGRTDLFFGSDDESRRARDRRELEAARICGGCPSRLPCREFAQALGIAYGVWGGLGEADRGPAPRRLPGMCGNGLHAMDEANTYFSPQGWEVCRACRAAGDRRYRQARRQQKERAA
jgi:WhiB family redox-sensing transcriptional regulator